MHKLGFEEFEFVRHLASGGMSDLYVVRDGRERRLVLRLLRKEFARRRRFRKQFLASGEIMRNLHHRHVVRLHDVGLRGDQPYMVLEYLEGSHLREHILHRTPALTNHTLTLLRQMAAALYYVHAAGYLHLDFKPENLVLREGDGIALVDFDLALPVRVRPHRLRELPGTPAYLAPETLLKHRADERTDIFAFGVTAYEMLTFHKPFEADTLEKQQAMQVNPQVDPAPMRLYRDDVSSRLETIIRQCLAKDWEARYPAMSNIVKDLEHIT